MALSTDGGLAISLSSQALMMPLIMAGLLLLSAQTTTTLPRIIDTEGKFDSINIDIDTGQLHQPDPDIHIPPVPRHMDSVVPEYYYHAPHNSNPHPYKYIINNPDACAQKRDVFLVMLVRTSARHCERRSAIRDTWGASYNLPHLNIPLVFLIAHPQDGTAQRDLVMENDIYQDIVQEDFLDTYGNSTLKTVMAYKWAYMFCRHASFVLVSNDDIIVDIYKLVPYLSTLQFQDSRQFSLCYLYPCCMVAESSGKSKSLKKWSFKKLDLNVYHGKAYPAYCSTRAYVAPSSVIHSLYLMSLDTPSFTPEEPWVGVLVEKLGLSYLDTYKSYIGLDTNIHLIDHFNSTGYLHNPTIIGVIGSKYPHKEAYWIRRIWYAIKYQHRERPLMDAKRYMGIAPDPDKHVYTVAAGALILDLVVMIVIGYIIFCKRRRKS